MDWCIDFVAPGDIGDAGYDGSSSSPEHLRLPDLLEPVTQHTHYIARPASAPPNTWTAGLARACHTTHSLYCEAGKCSPRTLAAAGLAKACHTTHSLYCEAGKCFPEHLDCRSCSSLSHYTLIILRGRKVLPRTLATAGLAGACHTTHSLYCEAGKCSPEHLRLPDWLEPVTQHTHYIARPASAPPNTCDYRTCSSLSHNTLIILRGRQELAAPTMQYPNIMTYFH